MLPIAGFSGVTVASPSTRTRASSLRSCQTDNVTHAVDCRIQVDLRLAGSRHPYRFWLGRSTQRRVAGAFLQSTANNRRSRVAHREDRLAVGLRGLRHHGGSESPSRRARHQSTIARFRRATLVGGCCIQQTFGKRACAHLGAFDFARAIISTLSRVHIATRPPRSRAGNGCASKYSQIRCRLL
jgi:hypothetical protein